MKNHLLLTLALFLALAAQCANVTAVTNNGSWTATTTWSSNSVPANGDNVIIPSNITVQVTGDVNISSTVLTVQVYGVLDFIGGGAKLRIAAGSTITVYSGGTIQGQANASQIIQIGSDKVFDAKTLNVVNGPSYANSTTIGFIPIVPLAVKFSSFTATQENKEVLIKWITAAEENTSYFEIERSEDGLNFIAIGRETAANTTAGASYTFTDFSNNNGKRYFRIKEVDANGSFAYTKIVEVAAITFANASVNILSVNHSLLLQFPQQSANVKLTLITLGGQIVSEQSISQPAAQVIVPVNSSLHGNLIVSITDGKSLRVAKQVILN